MFYVLHLHKGREVVVFDVPKSLRQDIKIGDTIAINEIYYKVYDIQYRFEVKEGNLAPFEAKVSARDKEEEFTYKSVESSIDKMERAIDFFKRVHPLLNTGHSLLSAYEHLYKE